MKQFDKNSPEFKRASMVGVLNGAMSVLAGMSKRICLEVIKTSGEDVTPLDLVQDMADAGSAQFDVMTNTVLNALEGLLTPEQAEEEVNKVIRRDARRALTKFLAKKAVSA